MKTEHIKLLVVDDHPLWAKVVAEVFDELTYIKKVHIAGDGASCIETMQREQIDVVLLDLELPDTTGIKVCKRIKNEWPNATVIALSQFDERGFIKSMFLNGARGYLLKSSPAEQLIELFEQVVFEDELVFDPQINAAVIEDEHMLTERESEVLRLICEQYSSKQIAEILGISKNTVDNHRKSILQKTNTQNTAGLVKWAFMNDIM